MKDKYNEENFKGIFRKKELKKFFYIEKIKKEFGEKYSLISKDKALECILERYYLSQDYEIAILSSSGKTDKVFFDAGAKYNICEIMYCFEGECKIYTENGEYLLKKGDILIYKMNNKNINEYKIESSNFKIILIFLNIDLLVKNFIKSINEDIIYEWKKKMGNIFKNCIFCYGESNSKINLLANKIGNMSIASIDDYLEFRMQVFKFLFLILKVKMNPVKKLVNDEEIAKRLKEMLNEYQISEMPKIKEICETLEMSYYNLQKVFKKVEGMSISQYIQKRKMDYSKLLLEKYDKSVFDVAIEVGYENPSKFSKSFKKSFGILPSKYKKTL